jgi:hypothetical protein
MRAAIIAAVVVAVALVVLTIARRRPRTAPAASPAGTDSAVAGAVAGCGSRRLIGWRTMRADGTLIGSGGRGAPPPTHAVVEDDCGMTTVAVAGDPWLEASRVRRQRALGAA